MRKSSLQKFTLLSCHLWIDSIDACYWVNFSAENYWKCSIQLQHSILPSNNDSSLRQSSDVLMSG